MQKKERIQLGVIAVALVGLIALGIPLFRGKPGATKQTPSSGVSRKAPSQQGVKTSVFSGSAIKLKQIKDDKFYERLSRISEALPLERNPFSFAETGTRSPRDMLELKGILWDDKKPTAIIDQAFLNEGDSLNEFKVVKIEPSRVTLKDNNGEFDLHLKP